MSFITKISCISAGVVFIALAKSSITQAATITLESARLDTTGQRDGIVISSDESIGTNQFLGWRFQLTNPLQVTDIGGHLASRSNFGNGEIFGAIISLSNSNAIPQGEPFKLGEVPGQVLATTSFNPGFPSRDVTVPLFVTLNPGNYALIFGTGLFGASGYGFMPRSQQDFPGSSYFFSVDTFWEGGSNFSSVRFVVKGESDIFTSIPEPTCTLGLLTLGISGAGLLRKRKHKQGC
jgi:hypothetical protein